MVRWGRDSPAEYNLTIVPCPISLQGMGMSHKIHISMEN